jgi:hypothetical protein
MSMLFLPAFRSLKNSKEAYDITLLSVPSPWSWSHVMTDGQSVRLSAEPTVRQILILSEICSLVSLERPLWREVGVCLLSVTVSSICPSWRFFVLLLAFLPILHVTHFKYIQYIQGLVSPGWVQETIIGARRATVAGQRYHGKNTQPTIGGLLEAVSSMRSVSYRVFYEERGTLGICSYKKTVLILGV